MARADSRMRALNLAAGLGAAAIGFLALVGWIAQVRDLTVFGRGIPMAPNTALAFVALGVAAVCAGRASERPIVRATVRALASVVVVLSLVRLVELATGLDMSSDRWFLAPNDALLGRWRTSTTLAPIAKIALPTALLLALAGAGLLLATFPVSPRMRVARGTLSAGLTCCAFVFVLGYLYGAPLLYEGQIIPMALNTAIGLTCLGVSMLAGAGLSAPPLRAFLGATVHARLLRLFLPFIALTVCAVPILTQWIESLAGERYAAISSALLVALSTVTASFLCARLAQATESGIARLEEQLRQSQKMDAIGRLAGGVAHDFNNVLTVINGFTDLAIDQLPADSPMRPQLEEVKKAGARAASLTRQLLLFSRKQEIRHVPVDLNVIVPDILKMLRRLLRENIHLESVLAERLDCVRADPGQIEQVILNLVVNARDAMPQGGKIRISTSNLTVDASQASRMLDVKPGAYVLLSVTDTGCGMSPEVRKHLFEPFFTTKAEGSGTGMGLASVHAIVKRHGGHLEVDSKVGQGTTFRIYLPQDPGASPSQISKPVGTFRRGGETILVVEDEPNIQAFIRSALQARGYTVVQAPDGTEAVRIGEGAGPIHLMLTDSVMPLMSGTDLARRMAAIRPNLKVVLMSGYPEQVVLDCPAARAFLQKPFSAQQLVSTVRNVLDDKKVEVQ